MTLAPEVIVVVGAETLRNGQYACVESESRSTFTAPRRALPEEARMIADLWLRSRYASIPAIPHYLNAPIDELWRRIQTRNLEPPWDSEPILRAHLVEWASTFQEPDAAELALFDPLPDAD